MREFNMARKGTPIHRRLPPALGIVTRFILLASQFLLQASLPATAQTTVFTYHGRLTDRGSPANGRYDFIFQIFDAANAGGSVGGGLAVPNVLVRDGLFTAALDFGSAPFSGSARWLQIQVSTNGAGVYSTLSPRQSLTAAPYSIYANTAGGVANGAISSAQLASGAVTSSQLAVNAVDRSKIASGQVVKSFNTLKDDVTLVPGANVTLNTAGNSLVISAITGDLAGTNFARLNLNNSAAVAAGVPTVFFGFLVNATVTRGGFGHTPPESPIAKQVPRDIRAAKKLQRRTKGN